MRVPICKMPDAAVDRWWPNQIAIQAYLCTGWNFEKQREFCEGLSLFERIDFVRDDDGFAYRVFCFADADHAREFSEAFNGVPLYPEDRGLDEERWKWSRPLGDVRRKHPLVNPYGSERLR